MTTQLALAEPTPLHASAWPRWSPDGEAVALLTARAQVTIFGGDLGRKLKEFKPLADDIQHLEWSPDGSLLMCGQYKANTVTVLHAVGDKGVMAVITDPTFSIPKACWAPTSAHILTFSELDLRTTVWALATGEQHILEYVGRRRERGIAFRPDGRMAAIAERRDGADHVLIVDCATWTVQRRFALATRDLESVDWTANGRAIVVADTSLTYAVYIYSPTGDLLQSFTPFNDQLGVKAVRVSSLSMVALGSYDEQVRLLDPLQWVCCGTFLHNATIGPNDDTPIYVEVEVPANPNALRSHALGGLVRHQTVVQYEQVAPPYTYKPEAADGAAGGVGLLEFSPGGRFLASRNGRRPADAMPRAVWIWDLGRLKLAALLVHRQPVRGLKWQPARAPAKGEGAEPSPAADPLARVRATAQGTEASPTRPALGTTAAFTRPPEVDADATLAIWTDTSTVFLWQQPATALVVPWPYESPFTVTTLQWHPRGDGVLLAGKAGVTVGSLEVV